MVADPYFESKASIYTLATFLPFALYGKNSDKPLDEVRFRTPMGVYAGLSSNASQVNKEGLSRGRDVGEIVIRSLQSNATGKRRRHSKEK